MRRNLLLDAVLVVIGGAVAGLMAALVMLGFGITTTQAVSGTAPAPAASASAAPTTPVVKDVALPPRPWVKPSITDDYTKVLTCADTLTPIEVALGSHNDAGTTVTYSLTPHAGDDAAQKSVTLKVTAPAAAVAAAIVHASGGSSKGRSDDTELTLNVPAGGRASQDLTTAGYVSGGYDNIFSIVSVTLCTKKG